MRVWIFSDLHITQVDSEIYQVFLTALDQAKDDRDHVIFAGDIFDLMVGSSPFYEAKYANFFEKVRTLSRQGVKLHYIEGNHDFHLKSLFPETTDFQEEAVILSDQREPNLTKRLYIAHGDLIDSDDLAYLSLRKFLRSKPISFLASAIPGQWVEKIGLFFSRSLDQKRKDLNSPQVREKFRKFAEQKHAEGFDFIALGHCHDFDSILPFYFNMGYPPVQMQYLYYDSTSGLQRRAFN